MDKDRVDHYWREVFKTIESKTGEKPFELIKLIKILCSLSHGNGAIERGFTITKQLVQGRVSLNDTSVKGQKTVKEAIQAFGGAHNVPITANLLNSIKCAAMDKKKEDREAKRKEDTAALEKAEVAEAALRKEEKAANSQKWEDKKKQI